MINLLQLPEFLEELLLINENFFYVTDKTIFWEKTRDISYHDFYNFLRKYVKNINMVYPYYFKLTKIVLLKNSVDYIPHSFCNYYEQLTTLVVHSKKLYNLPSNIGNLKKLKRLYVNDCNLSYLPDSICDISTLSNIYCCDNNIVEFPENIGKLPNLKEIVANNNRIENIPKSFFKLKLSSIHLLNNNNLSISDKNLLIELYPHIFI